MHELAARNVIEARKRGVMMGLAAHYAARKSGTGGPSQPGVWASPDFAGTRPATDTAAAAVSLAGDFHAIAVRGCCRSELCIP